VTLHSSAFVVLVLYFIVVDRCHACSCTLITLANPSNCHFHLRAGVKPRHRFFCVREKGEASSVVTNDCTPKHTDTHIHITHRCSRVHTRTLRHTPRSVWEANARHRSSERKTAAERRRQQRKLEADGHTPGGSASVLVTFICSLFCVAP
jgi:hypothetical protein